MVPKSVEDGRAPDATRSLSIASVLRREQELRSGVMTISFEEIGGPHKSREARRKAMLRAIRALKRAPRGTRDALADILRLCRARRRAKLVEHGGAAEHIFLIAGGRVRVERATQDGRLLVLAQLGRGDLVGDLRLDQ